MKIYIFTTHMDNALDSTIHYTLQDLKQSIESVVAGYAPGYASDMAGLPFESEPWNALWQDFEDNLCDGSDAFAWSEHEITPPAGA